LCAALLCLFFSSGLNKTQFENVLEVSKFINSKNRYPKNFDECAKVLLDACEDSVTYDKKWFCNTCKIFVSLQKQHQRSCLICQKRFAYDDYSVKRFFRSFN